MATSWSVPGSVPPCAPGDPVTEAEACALVGSGVVVGAVVVVGSAVGSEVVGAAVVVVGSEAGS